MKTKGAKLVHTSTREDVLTNALADVAGFSFFELLECGSQGPTEVSLWSFISVYPLCKVILTFSCVFCVVGSSPLSIMISYPCLPRAGPFFLLTVLLHLPAYSCSPLSVTAKVLFLILWSSLSAGPATLSLMIFPYSETSLDGIHNCFFMSLLGVSLSLSCLDHCRSL